MTAQITASPPVTATMPHPSVPISMKAIAQDSYGSPDAVLKLEDVDVPVPGAGDVVVRVHTASVHVGDLVMVKGEPYVARMAVGMRKPKNRVPGTDVAGTVAAVGADVTELKVGDEVFGWCTGAFAEYVSASAGQFVPRPSNLTLPQAAAVGVSASTALQLLRGRVQPGNKVLINGASGGLGSFAVQIAKALGAEVTGVCSTSNMDTVRSIGADHVIDYTQEDFTTGGPRFDFILDNVANHSLTQTRRALTPTGILQSNNGTAGGRWLGTMGTVLKTAIVSKFTKRQAGPSIKFPNRDDLVALKELADAGKVTPLLDTAYPLRDSSKALDHVAKGHARGTVLITVGGSGHD